MFAVVKSEGRMYMPLRSLPRLESDERRRGVSSSILNEPPSSGLATSMSLPLGSHAGVNRLPNRKKCKHRRSSFDAIAGLHLDFSIAIKENIHARAEFDEPNPLAARYGISYFEVENNAARYEAGDLLEYYGTAVALHGDNVLLVLFRRVRSHGVEE